MARTINDIHRELKSNFIANTDLQTRYGFSPGDSFDASFSKVSIENLILYVVAVSIHIMDNLFDILRVEIDSTIALMRPHRLQWYVEKAKAFQYGDALVEDADYYPVVNIDKQIVSHASASEIAGTLFLKVAKLLNGILEPLSAQEYNAFSTYISKVKDAGVKINVISRVGDSLKIVMDVWYDPLVIDSDGKYINDGSKEPAVDTIMNYIQTLPFNGELVIAHLVDALQETEGILIPNILSAESKYGTNDYSTIDAKVVPDAGYFVIADGDLTINYRAYV